MMQPWYRFVLVGLLVAVLEEFITQGVLKDDFGGWIVPTLLAFTPFLIVVSAVARALDRSLGEPNAALVYYLVAGTIGLLFEWFAMGLGPWGTPSLLQVPFQIGMFILLNGFHLGYVRALRQLGGSVEAASHPPA
jgi:hypothetical protein